jgi:1-acyl-sn-glycerol-3-phosphate acyltransferase
VHISGVDKLPKTTPFLLVCNHLSNLDPLVTLAALRGFDLAFVSKPENFKIPLAGPIMRNASFLPIDRENPRNAVSTIKQAAKQIAERSLCMGIYPEGTRNKTKEKLLPFHNGSFKIATTAKCPIAVLTLRYEKGTLPHTRHAHLQVIEVLNADYVSENRTDAIGARVLSLIENNL